MFPPVSEGGSPPSNTTETGIELLGRQIGPYTLRCILGEGGYGIVYLAEQERPLKRQVAVKILKPGMDTKHVMARFESERQTLALLDHPNIAHVFDAGTTDQGRPYFAMEHVTGSSITQYCDQEKLAIEERLSLFLQVCAAIQYAHQKGIIHRDIKPSNILVSVENATALPKVIDFGIAKALNQSLTEKTFFTTDGQLIGTPEYMSPEQVDLRDKDIDTRSDVYSLGMVLYVLLTGVLPFDSQAFREGGMEQIRRTIREEEPQSPSTRLSRLSKDAQTIAENRQTSVAILTRKLHTELEWIPLKAMEKDCERRYQSAAELAQDIRNYQSGLPLSAGPPTTIYRLCKFIRRNRTAIIGLFTVLITLLAGVCVSTAMYVRAQRALEAKAELEGQMETDRNLSLAQQLYAEGRYQGALDSIETSSGYKDLEPTARLLYGRLLVEAGRYTDAEGELQKLLDERAEITGAAHAVLASIYASIYSDTEPTTAEEHQRIAESKLPQTADSYYLRGITANTPTETIEWLSKAIDLDPGHFSARISRTLAYYAIKDYQSMAHEAEVLTAIRPRDSLGYALRAIAYRETGRFYEAIKNYSRAIELCDIESELAELHNQRRKTYVCMGNLKAALRDAQRTAELEPEQFINRFHVFATLVSLHEYESARQEYENIMSVGLADQQQFDAWAQRHMFDILETDESLELPKNIINLKAFSAMQEAADYYKVLAAKATHLANGVYGKSSWSPDGKQLAYGRSDRYMLEPQTLTTGAPTISGSSGIEILDLESGTTRLLVGQGKDPAWSPDGKYIAFIRAPNYRFVNLEEIWLISAAGGEPRRLASGGWPIWTNDPEHLFFHSKVDDVLYRIQVNDLNAQPEKVVSCPAWFPGLSPDGKSLAFAWDGDLKIIELSSGSLETKWTLPYPYEVMKAHWSPNGREISLAGGWRGVTPCQWIFNVEQQDAYKVFDDPALHVCWSPDGNRASIHIDYPFEELWTVQLTPRLDLSDTLTPITTMENYTQRWIRHYTDLIQSSPKDAEMYTQRAAVYARSQKPLEAVADLKTSVELMQAKEGPKTEWISRLKGTINELSSLAMANYNADMYHNCLTVLRGLYTLCVEIGDDEACIDKLAKIVLVLHQLGEDEEARAVLDVLRDLITNGKYFNARQCYYQAEKLLASETTNIAKIWDHIQADRLRNASEHLEQLCSSTSQLNEEDSVNLEWVTKELARAYYYRGLQRRFYGGSYDDTIDDYKEAIHIDPDFARAHADLAWLQVAGKGIDSFLYEPAIALHNANRACTLTNWEDHCYVATLAAVHAKIGNYAKAINWQVKAINLLPKKTNPILRTNYQTRLELFRSEKSYDNGNLWSLSSGGMLIAHWKLDEESGSIVFDASGNNITGILIGDPQWRPKTGRFGGALEFDGDGDYIRIEQEAEFDFEHEMTVSAWVNISVVWFNWVPIVSKGNSAWRLQKVSEDRGFQFAVTGGPPWHYVNGKTVIPSSEWHHVCGVYDGSAIRIYVDGLEDGCTDYNGGITKNDYDVLIGTDAELWCRGREWNGLLDDIRIYSYALCPEDVKALYKGKDLFIKEP